MELGASRDDESDAHLDLVEVPLKLFSQSNLERMNQEPGEQKRHSVACVVRDS